jgi:hypothetical protein
MIWELSINRDRNYRLKYLVWKSSDSFKCVLELLWPAFTCPTPQFWQHPEATGGFTSTQLHYSPCPEICEAGFASRIVDVITPGILSICLPEKKDT